MRTIKDGVTDKIVDMLLDEDSVAKQVGARIWHRVTVLFEYYRIRGYAV